MYVISIYNINVHNLYIHNISMQYVHIFVYFYKNLFFVYVSVALQHQKLCHGTTIQTGIT